MTTTTRQRPPGGRPPAQSNRKRPPAPQQSAPLRLGNPRRRAGILLVFVLIVFTVFAGRLLEIQAFRGDALAAAAVDQRTTTVTVLADRGDILDARGVPLAITVESRHVTVDQGNIATHQLGREHEDGQGVPLQILQHAKDGRQAANF